MKVLYTEDPAYADRYGSAMFLAGPSPRSQDVKSWRPDAIKILESINFAGTVIVPERRDNGVKFDYLDQVEWEYSGLENATAIVFWVPRTLDTMPAFTTNVEFGRYVGRKNCVYGRPAEAPKNRYLDWLYTKVTKKQPLDTLEETIKQALGAFWF